MQSANLSNVLKNILPHLQQIQTGRALLELPLRPKEKQIKQTNANRLANKETNQYKTKLICFQNMKFTPIVPWIPEDFLLMRNSFSKLPDLIEYVNTPNLLEPG